MTTKLFSFWQGAALGEPELVCLNSYVQQGYQVELFAYDPIENLPPGVILRDAADVIPRSKVFHTYFQGQKTYAVFSDYFRFKYLYEHGGTWTDLDAVCLRNMDMLLDEAFIVRENDENIASGFVRFFSGNPVAGEIVENFERPTRFFLRYLPRVKGKRNMLRHVWGLLVSVIDPLRSYTYLPWGALGGPEYLSFRKAALVESGVRIREPHLFYSIPWQNCQAFLDPEFNYEPILSNPEAYSVHLYGSIFRKMLKSTPMAPEAPTFWNYFRHRFLGKTSGRR